MPQFDVIQLLVNGGFAAMFVWLLLTTRKESQDRETRLLSLIDKYAEKLSAITDRLERLTDTISELDRRIPCDPPKQARR